jgi:subtilisin family serine protease
MAKQERLFSALEKQHSGIELIVEVSNKDRCLRQLRHLGKCHAFEFIPYISLECSADDAKKISSIRYGKIKDRRFERSFSDCIEHIVSIEPSCKVSIPPMRAGINYYRKKNEQTLWNLENIGAYSALERASGAGISIGIIDTGCDYTHPEISRRFGMEKGYDFVENSGKPFDKNGHGTHVAGTAAGAFSGIARNSRLYAIRVLDSEGSGSEADVMKGIEWALKSRIDVVNMSLGSSEYSEAFKEMCYYACSRGMIVCAAAGNDGEPIYNYPASFEPVLSVAAVDKRNKHAYFSNTNGLIDISAPGVDIVSCWPGSGYRMLSGTSMAAPHVSGCVALALSAGVGKAQYEDAMKENAEKLNEKNVLPEAFGAGLIRIDKMVSSENSDYLQNIQKKQGLLGIIRSMWG